MIYERAVLWGSRNKRFVRCAGIIYALAYYAFLITAGVAG